MKKIVNILNEGVKQHEVTHAEGLTMWSFSGLGQHSI